MNDPWFLVSHSSLKLVRNMTLYNNNQHKKLLLLCFTLILLTVTPFYLNKNLGSSELSSQDQTIHGSEKTSSSSCDLFRGKWVSDPETMPYYTNESCNLIINQQNCMKFGRSDVEFLKWRWKPDECELPLFDAFAFLELVRGKSLAFIGDSVGRNQLQSLFCLLSQVAYPDDISSDKISYKDSKQWFYPDYNFTLAAFWSPFLIKSKEADPNGYSYSSIMNLYLDEADETWAAEIEPFDYTIVSAGQWFFRPLMLYEKNKLVGCYDCKQKCVTKVTSSYAYKKAFRTTFKTLMGLRNYKGVTFLRTFSPAHFENGEWNKGGNCVRTKPFTKGEVKFEGYILELYSSQVKEFKEAEKEGLKNGVKFKLLDTTEAMLMRPDGHPNHYGSTKNQSLADCVHWCSPGPIDTWNEFLLYIFKN